MKVVNLGAINKALRGCECLQIGQHHIVDASSEEEVCTLARYVEW